ncbi:M48 family metalloprotease [Sphingomonas bacterium]|uniref:M48 family metalloprotease n=1 Tax=Sphingomonas bacterium TaxID=1895847 RepID=UPI00262BDFD3|nr:M48 family metalloprotease [Sphingomonas bacterium]
MAHNILGHAAEMRAMKRDKDGLAGLLARPALTRRTEREADRLAAELVLDSGYTIAGAERVLHALDRGFTGPTFLANHDSTRDRIAALQAYASARAGSLQ